MDKRLVRGLVALSALVLGACALTGCMPTQTVDQPVALATATDTPVSTDTPQPAATTDPGATPTLSREDRPPAGAASEFTTDFSQHNVPYTEILSGGPRKDGIPAINSPKFVNVEDAGNWLQPQDPVILVQIDGIARAYPTQILMFHEIVNDRIGDLPVAITYCPLCNTALAFESRIDGRDLDFGTTGRLRYSNLVMYDRQTESWWQQATGDAIIGEFTGRQLNFIPAPLISWSDFRESFPSGEVLSRDTGRNAPYGRNPYAGYALGNLGGPFLFRGPATPNVLSPMEYVLTVDMESEAVTYPYDTLKAVQIVNDTIAGNEVVVLWTPGTAGSLDASTVAGGRDIGSANVFLRELNGEVLTFRSEDGKILDNQTDSEWNVLGLAISGELEDSQLQTVISINHFWFSWVAFRPDTRIYQPPPSS